VIELRTVLAQMEQLDRAGNLIPFKIDFVTADEQKQIGGDIMVFDKATLCFPNKSGTRKFNPKRMLEKQELAIKVGKAPDHVKNGTINILTDGKVLTKVSIWLIRYFNGEKVVLNIHG
jgi:hypothetical protein